MYNKILLTIAILLVTAILLISTLLISNINIAAQEVQQVTATFAKICGDGVGGAAMSFVPSGVTTAVKTFEIGECIATFGIGCAESIVGGKIKSAVTGKLLEALTAAVPQVRAPLMTYNMVKGYIDTGSRIKEGCLEADKDGLINEMDHFEISLDEEGNPQDISGLLLNKESAAELSEEEKILGGNVRVRKIKGKPFLVEAIKGKNSVVIINEAKANLESGWIKIERTKDKEGNLGMKVVEAKFIVGKGGAIVKFGEYEGKFKEGTHVLWNPEDGFSFPSGQDGASVELVNPEGEKASLILREDKAYAKIVQGRYQIKGKNFEVDGIKVYGSVYPTGQQAQATLIIEEKGSHYHKGRNTIVETKEGLKIGGDEIEIYFDSSKVADMGEDWDKKSWIFINPTELKIIELVSTEGNSYSIEFLEDNEFAIRNGKVEITTRENAVTIAEISDGGEINILVDSISGTDIANGELPLELKEGEIYVSAIPGCRVYSVLEDRAECEKDYGKTTPMKINVLDEKAPSIIETPQGTRAELSKEHTNYFVSVSDVDYFDAGKCVLEPTPEEGITGHAPGEGFIRKCTTILKGFFGHRVKEREDGKHIIYMGEDYKVTPIEGKEGIEYVAEEPSIRYFFNEKGDEKIAVQVQDKEGKWGKKIYSEEIEVEAKEEEFPAEEEKKDVVEQTMENIEKRREIYEKVGIKIYE